MAAFRNSQAPPMPHFHPGAEVCPLCEQAIPNDRLEEVQNRMLARNLQRDADAEARVEAAVEAALATAAARMASDFAAKEARIRDDVRMAAEQTMAAKISEAVAARAVAENKAAEIEAAREETIAARLLEQHDALERAKTDAVNAERSKNFEQHLKLESMVEDLKRKLQHKTSDELGEGAEIDLFDVLKAEFPEDEITRVGKGKAGADVIHKVRHNGALCGTIVYDSKNHQQWRNEHVTKLRQDQMDANADHAVLSTRAFPAGKKQLHMDTGVIVANPARAAVVALLLRKQIVQLYTLRVGNEERASKTDELYALMTSERFGQFLSGVTMSAGQLEAMQAEEKKVHEKIWKKQGELIRAVVRNCAQFDEDIARIIGTAKDLPELGPDPWSQGV